MSLAAPESGLTAAGRRERTLRMSEAQRWNDTYAAALTVMRGVDDRLSPGRFSREVLGLSRSSDPSTIQRVLDYLIEQSVLTYTLGRGLSQGSKFPAQDAVDGGDDDDDLQAGARTQ